MYYHTSCRGLHNMSISLDLAAGKRNSCITKMIWLENLNGHAESKAVVYPQPDYE